MYQEADCTLETSQHLNVSQPVKTSSSFMATGLSMSGLSKSVGNALELIYAAASFLNESQFHVQTTGETHASFFDSRIMVI